jgi:ABC-type arginine transport system permease subunit
VVREFTLNQNYPNPFNPSTTIRYGLPNRLLVTLTVYNTLGQQVATLVSGNQEAGYHEVKFDASGLSSGIYFYRMQAGSYVETKKLLLVR